MALLRTAVNQILSHSRKIAALTREVAELRKRLEEAEGVSFSFVPGNFVPGMFGPPLFNYLCLGHSGPDASFILAKRLAWIVSAEDSWVDVDAIDTEAILLAKMGNDFPVDGMFGLGLVVGEGVYQSIRSEGAGLPATIDGIASASLRSYYWSRDTLNGTTQGILQAYGAPGVPTCLGSDTHGLAYEFARDAYDPVIQFRRSFAVGTRCVMQFLSGGVPTILGTAEAEHRDCVVEGD